jgi:hypothetical protein
MIFLEAINNVGLLLLEVSNLDKDYISGSTLEKKTVRTDLRMCVAVVFAKICSKSGLLQQN